MCVHRHANKENTELHSADASKELLEVCLYDLWVGGLTQDLKQVLITDEVVL